MPPHWGLNRGGYTLPKKGNPWDYPRLTPEPRNWVSYHLDAQTRDPTHFHLMNDDSIRGESAAVMLNKNLRKKKKLTWTNIKPPTSTKIYSLKSD